MASAASLSRVLPALRQALPRAEQLSVAEAVRLQHGRDEGHFAPQAPDAVVFPETTDEAAAVVRVCAKHRVPVVPVGTGTGLEGGTVATSGGIAVSTRALDSIAPSHEGSLSATVGAGVTRKQLNGFLRGTGLFFSVDPGADASLGGMAATAASGTTTVRYGTMRQNVLAATAVLPDGRILRAGRDTRKSSAGFDLLGLLVGSEGTLGLITELTVRLHPLPDQIVAGVCAFPDLGSAVASVQDLMALGLPIARLEMLDRTMLAACNNHSKLGLPDAPHLFLELHGCSSDDPPLALVRDVLDAHGGGQIAFADTPEERSSLWAARHVAYYAALALRPGATALTTDVCVPLAALAECIAATHRDIVESGITAPIVSHAGDGNFHCICIVTPGDAEEIERINKFNERLVRRAQACGGTCTGEHGVGMGKRQFLAGEWGAVGIDVMRAIKGALDPDSLFNPGKVLPPP